MIIAPPSAAKRIKSWNYFDESKVWSFSNYSPDRPGTVFDLQLPLEPDARTVVHPGQLTLAFMPAKFDVVGLHQGVGITYKAPIFTNSDEDKIGLGVSLYSLPTQSSVEQPPIAIPPVPALPPTPPESPTNTPFTSKPRHRPPRLPLDRAVMKFEGQDLPSPPMTAHPPPPIPDSEEPKGFRHRAISSSSMRSLYNQASRIVTKSTPNLRQSGGRRLQRKHQRSSSTQAPPDDHAQAALSATDPTFHATDTTSPMSPATPAFSFSSPTYARFSSSKRYLGSPPNPILPISPPLSITSPLPRPSTSGRSVKTGHTISVLYSPHGISYSTIKPWAEHHLVPLSALPLTLMLHPLTFVQNWWLLGGNIMTGWRGGAEIARNLMARCWLAAHDGAKDESGLLLKTVKKGQWSLEGVRKALRNSEGVGDDFKAGEKNGRLTEVLQLGVGGVKTLA